MWTLDENNLIVRIAYLFTRPPTLTNLCALFWRVAGICALLVAAGIGLGAAITQFYMYFWLTVAAIVEFSLLTVGVLVGFVAIVANLDPEARRDLPRSLRFITAPYLAVSAAKNSGLCPLIRINRDHEAAR